MCTLIWCHALVSFVLYVFVSPFHYTKLDTDKDGQKRVLYQQSTKINDIQFPFFFSKHPKNSIKKIAKNQTHAKFITFPLIEKIKFTAKFLYRIEWSMNEWEMFFFVVVWLKKVIHFLGNHQLAVLLCKYTSLKRSGLLCSKFNES